MKRTPSQGQKAIVPSASQQTFSVSYLALTDPKSQNVLNNAENALEYKPLIALCENSFVQIEGRRSRSKYKLSEYAIYSPKRNVAKVQIFLRSIMQKMR